MDVSTTPGAAPGIQVRDLTKTFPGVVALDNVNLNVPAGSVHALLGENGAGKSTLVRALAGQVRPDSGHIWIGGVESRPRSIRDARQHGIAFLPQEVALIPNASVGRNILVGSDRLFTNRARLRSTEKRRARQFLGQVGLDLDPETPTGALSVSQQRLVQIARAIATSARVLILDEPTAVLSDPDARAFLSILDELRAEHRTVIYITHRLGEVIEHCDAATVLRNGRVVGELAADTMDRQHIIELLLGGRGVGADRRTVGSVGDTILEAEHLRTDKLDGVRLEVRRGEVLGVAGVQGSGIQDLMHALAGVSGTGRVTVEGEEVGAGARHRYQSGIVYVPADRRNAGVVTRMSISGNVAATARASSKRFGLRRQRAERTRAREYVERLDIRGGGIDAPAATLSGGNQQKLALSRALEARPRVLLVAEPTQGVDVGSKQEIRTQLGDLADQHDMALVVASSDFEELEGLADRVIVLREGRLVAVLDGDEINYRTMLHHALG